MSQQHKIAFVLNGKRTHLSVPVTMSTLEMLRGLLEMSGTKLGCGEGECGACTIIVDGDSINACLMFAVECDGRELTTIEGLGEKGDRHTLQESFISEWAIQCGFCSPGMIMQAKGLLDKNPNPSRDEIKRAIEGNLCRCTGYTKIIDAIEVAAGESRK